MRCLQSVYAAMRGRDFKLAMIKGEFGNFCVVVAAWGALFGAVAATNYFSHGAVRLITEDSPPVQNGAVAESTTDGVIAHLGMTKFPKANSPVAAIEAPQADLSKDVVYQRLLREQPDLRNALNAKKGKYVPPQGPVFHYARANAFDKIITGDYRAAEEMFKLASRHPDQSHMCGEPNGKLQIEWDLALLNATKSSTTDPASATSLFYYKPDTLETSFVRADLSERADDPGMFITYLRHGISDRRAGRSDSPDKRVMKSWALAQMGELSPAERAAVNALCDAEILNKSSSALIECARYLAATGKDDRATDTFKAAVATNYWDNGERVFALYQHYKTSGQWYKAYDFALEGSRSKDLTRFAYLACLVDFYVRLEQRPKWREKIFTDSPALAVELKNSSWKNDVYTCGREALLRDLQAWTTEQKIAPWAGKGPVFLCAPLLQNLIAWCKIENSNEKLVPLLNLNLGMAKEYGTTGDVVNALSLLADYYNSKGDSARADKYYATLVKAATSADNRVVGLGGGLWINELSIEQLSKAWSTPAEKVAIISALKRSRDNVVQEFGANSLQEMMQIRNTAHFLLACGDSGESTRMSSKAWSMALNGKTFPIEERRKVLVDYIAGLNATKNEKVAEKLVPLLGAISDPDQN